MRKAGLIKSARVAEASRLLGTPPILIPSLQQLTLNSVGDGKDRPQALRTRQGIRIPRLPTVCLPLSYKIRRLMPITQAYRLQRDHLGAAYARTRVGRPRGVHAAGT